MCVTTAAVLGSIWERIRQLLVRTTKWQGGPRWLLVNIIVEVVEVVVVGGSGPFRL